MQLTNVFKPVRVKGRILAKNVVTGEIAAKGMIRDTQLRTAETNKELCIVSASGRVTRIPAMEMGILPEKAPKPKMSFMTAKAEIDPAIMFANIERLTKMVGKGIQPSLVITGSAGTGKTHLVKSTLAGMGLRESFEFVHFKGRATAAGLFVTLYENCDKIVILDDCDSVFKDEFGSHLPRTFEFTGKIIFISNIAQSSLDEAIRSRSFVADVDLTKKQMFARVEQLMDKMESGIPVAAKTQALDLMKELEAEFEGVDINLRSFIKAARICAMGFEDPKMMIAEQIIGAV